MLQQAVFLCLLLAGMAKAQIAFGTLKGTLSESKKFPHNTKLTDFVKDPITYMFNQVGGEMVAQQEGYYYVYSQVFFENYQDAPSGIYRNAVELYVNDFRVGVMQTGIDNRADYGTEYTGQVVKLNVGDRIGLKTVSESRIWLTSSHTFFGAYRIDSDTC
ncbi:Tumor necrosis factorigand superfamily member 13B [Porites harrisoni]